MREAGWFDSKVDSVWVNQPRVIFCCCFDTSSIVLFKLKSKSKSTILPHQYQLAQNTYLENVLHDIRVFLRKWTHKTTIFDQAYIMIAACQTNLVVGVT